MPLIFILLFLGLDLTYSQVTDNFGDGDFIANPPWTGISGHFVVDAATGALQLQAPREAGVSWLFTGSRAMEEARWQFRFRLGFNPSDNNFATVYLAADNNTPALVRNAFYLVIGRATDNVSLWQLRENRHTLLVAGAPRRFDSNTVEAGIRVTRRAGVIVLESNTGSGWVEEGRYHGAAGHDASWFGFSCHYTATRSGHFWFGDVDITGLPYRDTMDVKIAGAILLNRREMRLEFSKPVAGLLVHGSNFLLQPGNLTPGVIVDSLNERSLVLSFASGFPSGQRCYLYISGISDKHGNSLADSVINFTYVPPGVTSFLMTSPREANICFSRPVNTQTLLPSSFLVPDGAPAIDRVVYSGNSCYLVHFTGEIESGKLLSVKLTGVFADNGDPVEGALNDLFYYQVKRNDLVFSEVMSNPGTISSLPASEYLEVYNRGNFPVDLSGFTLHVGSRRATLGGYLLFPGDYLLLIPNGDDVSWQSVPGRLAVSPWPLLPNGGGEVVLRDKANQVVASVRYNPGMGQQGFKTGGGWSLEVIDTGNLSGSWGNWDFSISKAGGTPGAENSVKGSFADSERPFISGNFMQNDSCLVIEFSEPMSASVDLTTTNIGVSASSLRVADTHLEELFQSSLMVCLSSPVPANVPLELRFTMLPTDMAGNPLLESTPTRFANPVAPLPGDIVINELLFDPPTGGSDFVELYNRSGNIVDLSMLFLARAARNNIPEKLEQVTGLKRSFFPGQYLAFVNNREWLLSYYHMPSALDAREMANLPNFLAEGGTVFLTGRAGDQFDRFDYHPGLHYRLLSSTKGVSLERVSANAPSADINNWHSASSAYNHATPGQRNSQAMDHLSGEPGGFYIEQPFFTPDQDGHDDILLVNYRFDAPGFTCTVKIFDRSGFLVRQLVNNELAGASGFFAWDGLNDAGEPVNSGIYVVLARYFNLGGVTNEYKKAVVLGSTAK